MDGRPRRSSRNFGTRDRRTPRTSRRRDESGGWRAGNEVQSHQHRDEWKAGAERLRNRRRAPRTFSGGRSRSTAGPAEPRRKRDGRGSADHEDGNEFVHPQAGGQCISQTRAIKAARRRSGRSRGGRASAYAVFEPERSGRRRRSHCLSHRRIIGDRWPDAANRDNALTSGGANGRRTRRSPSRWIPHFASRNCSAVRNTPSP